MTDPQQAPAPESPRKNAWVKPFLFLMAIIAGVIIYARTIDYFSFKVAKYDLHAVHADVKACEVCHYPDRKIRPVNCTVSECHTAQSFQKGKPATASLLYQHIMHRDCLNCHTEHKGREGQLTKPFDHKTHTAGKCAECHLLPDQHVADVAEKDCGGCHKITGFKVNKES